MPGCPPCCYTAPSPAEELDDFAVPIHRRPLGSPSVCTDLFRPVLTANESLRPWRRSPNARRHLRRFPSEISKTVRSRSCTVLPASDSAAPLVGGPAVLEIGFFVQLFLIALIALGLYELMLPTCTAFRVLSVSRKWTDLSTPACFGSRLRHVRGEQTSGGD